MARKPASSPELVAAAAKEARRSATAHELRLALAFNLPARCGLTLRETGEFIGRSRATVARLRKEFRAVQQGEESPRRRWGGRRRQNMTLEEERAFLAPFFEQARSGGVLIVAPIKAAYERKIGRSVPSSTIYRLLARNGWRKLAPDKRHPKSDPETRKEWKKNSPIP